MQDHEKQSSDPTKDGYELYPDECLPWPAALRKSFYDKPFSYAAFVANLGIVYFEGSDLSVGLGDGETSSIGWVHLELDNEKNKHLSIKMFARGIDVRLDDIRWVADCPGGS